MTSNSRFWGRVSILDVLTIVVLGVAVYLLVRPGSGLHLEYARWRRSKEMRAAAQRDWHFLTSAGIRLYSSDRQPQVIEFMDYECPFCRAAAPVVDSAVRAGVRIAVIQFPLPIHPHARAGALAALCVAGSGDFITMHDYLMTSTSWMSWPRWPADSGPVGVSGNAMFADCVSRGVTGPVLAHQIALADSLHITATPTFVSAGHVLDGPATVASLERLASQ